MKKYLALVLSACVLLAFAACARQPQPAISTDTQQIPNPWTDYASLDEAEAAAGFDLAIPDAVDGCSEKQFRAMELTSGDAAVTMKGADGLVQLAIWQADGYTYAVSVENGLTADAMAELVAQVR